MKICAFILYLLAKVVSSTEESVAWRFLDFFSIAIFSPRGRGAHSLFNGRINSLITDSTRTIG